jgi:hypothetical protein
MLIGFVRCNRRSKRRRNGCGNAQPDNHSTEYGHHGAVLIVGTTRSSSAV